MRIYLIRHGQTCWNSAGKAQGHMDVELDKVGMAQARLVANFFEFRAVSRILSSDLVRCLGTAEPTSILTETSLEVTSTLRERTFGELEGQHYTVLRAFFDGESRDRGTPRWEVRPRGGESLADVWERVKPTVDEMISGNGDTVVFSHGGTCALILAQILRAPLETAMSFRFDNASITEVKRLPNSIWQLQRYSDVRHLEVLNDDPGLE